MRRQAIGVFDSGYGGLTILKELYKELPDYDFIYLGDNARSPYGTRSFDVVYEYTIQAVKTLFDMGCELVILACNTASAKALRTIQQKDLPSIDPTKRVLGVIRPSVEEIGQLTKNNHVGILGTVGTIRSDSYPLEIAKLNPEIEVVQQACPMWVPLVENKEFESDGGLYFVEKYILELLQKDSLIDTIVLACTHYPILKEQIQSFLPKDIKVISQGEIVAKSLRDYLYRHPEMEAKCSKNGLRSYYTTEFVDSFQEKASIFMNEKIEAKHIRL